MIKSFRLVTYEENKGSYHYKNLPYGTTLEAAEKAVREGQLKCNVIWIEVAKNGKWEKYEFQQEEPSE